MAVTYVTNNSFTGSSTASTTIFWTVPSTPTANDVWLLTGYFRAGSTVTISGVPASFNLIQRVDAGSGTTVATIVAYWYLANGTETGQVGSITLSASSKWNTLTDGVRGANTTTPIKSGTIKTASGTGIKAVDASSFSSGELVYGAINTQGSTTALTYSTSVLANLVQTRSQNSTGGSAATNISNVAGYDIVDTAGATGGFVTNNNAPSTTAGVSFVISAASAPAVTNPEAVRIVGNSAAIQRASNW